MERNRISAGVGRIIALALFGSLVACDFEPDVPNIPWPTPPERPFSGFSSKPDDFEESPEMALIRLFDELYDPYNLPGDLPYEGSVYERMDVILKGAYAYYGHDLAELARNRQDNPITDQMFLDYLVSQHVTLIEDRITGEKYPVYDWLQSRTIGAGGGIYSTAVEKIGGLDRTYLLNYERNYLAALFNAHPLQVILARDEFRKKLFENFREDPAGAYEWINNLDQFEVQ